MRHARFVNDFARTMSARKNIAVAAALVVSALVATPVAMGASRALATSDEPTAIVASLRVAPAEVTPVAAPAAQPCLRKVRVVYGGYGTPADGCIAR